uniref:Uncharacterized protein n=1 Tax=Poecilia latipinna TaxID=48699 RepID=A0A3B3VKV4_9TELE
MGSNTFTLNNINVESIRIIILSLDSFKQAYLDINFRESKIKENHVRICVFLCVNLVPVISPAPICSQLCLVFPDYLPCVRKPTCVSCSLSDPRRMSSHLSDSTFLNNGKLWSVITKHTIIKERSVLPQWCSSYYF